MNDALAILKLMAQKAGEMAHSAKYGAWDELVDKEKEEAALMEALRKLAPPATEASPSRQEQKAALIREILAYHEEVRSYVDPWREHVQPLLQALAPRSNRP